MNNRRSANDLAVELETLAVRILNSNIGKSEYTSITEIVESTLSRGTSVIKYLPEINVEIVGTLGSYDDYRTLMVIDTSPLRIQYKTILHRHGAGRNCVDRDTLQTTITAIKQYVVLDLLLDDEK